MATTKINDGVYTPHEGNTKIPTSKKGIQCNFRLLNILFSDEFATPFSKIGNPVNREQLDTRIFKKNTFWEDVAKRFADTDANAFIINIHFKDNYTIKAMKIDCSKSIKHDGNTLHQIYKTLNGFFQKSDVNFRQSGVHEDDFFNFCNGRLDVLYLHRHLTVKPLLNGVVKTELPADAFYDSGITNNMDIIDDDSEKKKPPARIGKIKAKVVTDSKAAISDSIDQVLSAINNFASADEKDTKQNTETLANREDRNKKRSTFDMEHREFKFNSNINDRIKLLRRELVEETIKDNREIIEEELEELVALKKKKRK